MSTVKINVQYAKIEEKKWKFKKEASDMAEFIVMLLHAFTG